MAYPANLNPPGGAVVVLAGGAADNYTGSGSYVVRRGTFGSANLVGMLARPLELSPLVSGLGPTRWPAVWGGTRQVSRTRQECACSVQHVLGSLLVRLLRREAAPPGAA